jgi:hypothetical protein
MATTVPTESIDQLHHQVAESLGAFQCQHEEADRVAALKAAQKLVNALQKPQDSVYHLAYSVIIGPFRVMTLVLTRPSLLTPYVCALPSTWVFSQR